MWIESNYEPLFIAPYYFVMVDLTEIQARGPIQLFNIHSMYYLNLAIAVVTRIIGFNLKKIKTHIVKYSIWGDCSGHSRWCFGCWPFENGTSALAPVVGRGVGHLLFRASDWCSTSLFAFACRRLTWIVTNRVFLKRSVRSLAYPLPKTKYKVPHKKGYF